MRSPTPERELLLRYLNGQREHLLSALDDLDDDALCTATLPSAWTPLGLVSHLTHDVELFWFTGAVAADPQQIQSIESSVRDAWRPNPATSPSSVIQAYRDACERSDAIVRTMPLDAPPNWWPRMVFDGDWRLESVREVLLHVIVETAAHAGQLDAARELLDGRQWLVLD